MGERKGGRGMTHPSALALAQALRRAMKESQPLPTPDTQLHLG